MKRIHTLAATALAVAMAGGASAGIAQAHGLGSTPRFTAPGQLGAAPTESPAMRSPNYVGYLGQISTGVTSAGTTVTVPSIRCPATGFDQTVLTADIGDTTNDALSAVLLNCVNGTAVYRLAVETDGTPTGGGSVQPGDKVVLSADVTGSATFAQAVDRTDGVSLSTNGGAPTSTPDEYFVGLFANSFGSLTPFSRVGFNDAQVNGAHLASLNPPRYSLVSSSGDAFATPFAGPFAQGFGVYYRPAR